MLFELYSFTLGLHHDARFLHLPDACNSYAGRARKTDCFVSKRKPLGAAGSGGSSGAEKVRTADLA
jgi:hypothetical protein